MRKFETKNILGVNVANVTIDTIVPTIIDLIESDGKKTFFYANPQELNLYKYNLEFKCAMDKASFIYPDGIGVIFASKILKKPLMGRTTLLDFIYDLLKIVEEKKWSLYILGGKKKLSDTSRKNLKKKFPNLIIYNRSGYFSESETGEIISDINKKNPTLLFVGMGSPRQEIWIDKHINTINAKGFFGVGGSMDVISGLIPRAPKVLRDMGCEWIYRMYKEPRRMWKRYIIGSIVFILRVFQNVIVH